MLITIKGEEDTRKEVDVPEAVEQQAELPKEMLPEPSNASPGHTLPLTQELDMQENIKAFESLAEATAKCLLDDNEMRSLLSAATTKVSNERLTTNLVILLKDFAQRLTTDSSLESVAHFVSVRPSDDQNYY